MAKKSNKGLEPLAPRVTMVQPPPAKPDQLTLEEVLAQAGNNRAYTVIRQHGNAWRVHFEGDYTPSTVKLINGKAVITKDDEKE